MARSLGTIKAVGTHKERSQKRIALALEVCTTAVTETSSAPPMIGMRTRGLQVLDLKAAGALPSSAMAEAACPWSHTIMLALSCMHHAPSESRSQTFSAGSLTHMNPSTTCAGSLPDVAPHRHRCAAPARRSEGSAVATEKAETAHHRGRPWCSDKHSGHSGAMPAATIGQPRRPVACSRRPQR